MKNELIIPIPEVIDKDAIKAKVQMVGDIKKVRKR